MISDTQLYNSCYVPWSFFYFSLGVSLHFYCAFFLLRIIFVNSVICVLFKILNFAV